MSSSASATLPAVVPARPLIPWLALPCVVGAALPLVILPSGFAAWAWLGALPLALAAAWLAPRWRLARVLLALAGLAFGTALALRQAQPDAGPRVIERELTIATASPGSYGQRLRCSEDRSLSLIAPSGIDLRPGDRVHLRGAWSVRNGEATVQILSAERTLPREAGPRAAAWAAIERLGSRRELAASLLLGAGHPEERRDFRRAGLAHVLAVSGMHLAVAAALGWWLLRQAGVGWATRLVALAGLVAGYTWLTGSSPATVRALVMTLLALGCSALGRAPHLISLISTTALLIVLMDPGLARDVGFQLSLGAVLGIVTLGKTWVDLRRAQLPLAAWPLDRPTWRALLWVARSGADSLLIGGAASLAVMPLVAAYFSTANPWSPLATVVCAVPAAVALWFGLPWLALSSLWPEGPWAGACWILDGTLDALAWLVAWTADWRAATIAVTAPPLVVITCWPFLFVSGPSWWGWLRAGLAGILVLTWRLWPS